MAAPSRTRARVAGRAEALAADAALAAVGARVADRLGAPLAAPTAEALAPAVAQADAAAAARRAVGHRAVGALPPGEARASCSRWLRPVHLPGHAGTTALARPPGPHAHSPLDVSQTPWPLQSVAQGLPPRRRRRAEVDGAVGPRAVLLAHAGAVEPRAAAEQRSGVSPAPPQPRSCTSRCSDGYWPWPEQPSGHGDTHVAVVASARDRPNSWHSHLQATSTVEKPRAVAAAARAAPSAISAGRLPATATRAAIARARGSPQSALAPGPQ